MTVFLGTHRLVLAIFVILIVDAISGELHDRP